MLHLKILGTLSLHAEPGRIPAEARQKRRLALLALLAVSGTRGISRDKLQAYLWPESSSDRARHALDQLIYAARRSLGADPIVAEGRDLKLDPSVITTDLFQFQNAIAASRLDEAVGLYGGPLLDGFYLCDSRELESWIDSERSKVESRYHSALESLATCATERGDYAAGAEWWSRLASSDPLSSRIAAATIRALIRAHDNPRAIKHARTYQAHVRKVLEVEPDPAIEALIADLPRAQFVTTPDVRQPVSAVVSTGESEHDPMPVHAGEPVTYSPRSGFNQGAILAGVLSVLLIAGSVGMFRRAKDDQTAPHKLIVDPQAKALYLRGLNSWNDRSKTALDTAVVYFRKAIEAEPDFADAYAGLANAYVMIGYSGYRSADAMFPKAKAAALRAIDLDSTIAAPYAALGMELTWERKFADAEAAYRKALALDPNYATAHQWHGILRMILGDTKGAVAETGRAAQLDPLSLQIQNNYATFLSASGQRDAALHVYQKVVGDEPDSAWVRRNPWLLTNMANVYALNGDSIRGIQFAKKALQVVPGHPRAASALATIYYRMGRKEDARAAFAQADTTNEHFPAMRALLYVAEGQPDSAFMWFDRVKDWGIPIMISMNALRHSPVVANDPRTAALFRRLGLPFEPQVVIHH